MVRSTGNLSSVYNLLNDYTFIEITYQQQWLSYVFLLYHSGRPKSYFIFEILNYAIKYKI